MKYRKCQICWARSERKGSIKRDFMARFPLDEFRCKQWVKMTGNEDLAYIPIEKLHALKFVCGKHFEAKDFKKKKTQLKKTAIPLLNLSSPPLPDEVLTGFPCRIYKEQFVQEIEKIGEEKRHIDHAYAKQVKQLPRAANVTVTDSTKTIDSPEPSSCTTAKYVTKFHRPCTKLLPHDLDIIQSEAMDADDLLDAPLSPEDNIPSTHGSSHTEHHGTSLFEDHQTVRNNQTTGTDPQDSSLLDDDPIRDLGIDDSVSELLTIASEHPALKKIEVDEESIERVERDQCTALYMELLERICDAFDRIPRFVKEKLPGYDEKVYAQMAQLKIKLKIVIKPLVKECVRVDDPLALEEHCTDVTKLYGDDTRDAELQEAEKSNFAPSATYNQATVCLKESQQVMEIEYLEENLETDEIENLQESHSVLKHKDIHKKEYLKDKLSKNPENTAYKVRTHPSPRVHSGKPYRNLKPYVLLEDYRRSSNTLHNTAINRNLKGQPTGFIIKDNHTESSFLLSTAESPHKYKVKIKYNIPRKELNS